MIRTFAQEVSDPVTQKFKCNLIFISITNICVLRLKRSLILKFFLLFCVRTKDHMGRHNNVPYLRKPWLHFYVLTLSNKVSPKQSYFNNFSKC